MIQNNNIIRNDYFIELPELAIGGDHEIVAAKELKDNYIKVEHNVICHDGESIQVCMYLYNLYLYLMKSIDMYLHIFSHKYEQSTKVYFQYNLILLNVIQIQFIVSFALKNLRKINILR